MTTNLSMDSLCHEDKKNIKNIYVQKINSLMKLSKDTLIRDDYQSSHHHEKQIFVQQKEKVQKNQLLTNTLKLQKNRESAKKARLRKKIYIKMLESQIQCFKKIKVEGEQLNEQSQSFLNNKQNEIIDIEMNQLIQHDVNVDKFLSGSDFGEVMKIENQEFQKKLKTRDGVVQQLYQLSTSSLIKKIKGAKNLQVFEPILKKQAQQNFQSFQNLIKRIGHHYEVIKNSFRKVHELTQKSKKLSKNCRSHIIQNYEMNKYNSELVSVSQFMQKMDLNRQGQYNEIKSQSMIEQTLPITGKNSQKSLILSNDFNLHATQKILIRSQKFFQHTYFEQEQ